jgi:predicted NBD/HSP70 family sugar kinase
VVDGEVIFSEEVLWHPKLSENPQYQYDGIMDSVKTAASKMDRVDAIGVSAAGIYIDNEVKAASLFIKVPPDLFEKHVKNMFIDIAGEFGVPIDVANDGDVTALAGAMSLGETGILGIAMGTAEAGGYVDVNGLITGWLNELSFVPVDYSMEAMMDEWSGDIGCGVKYFSQDGIIKLAENAGIKFDENLSPAEKLIIIQKLMEGNDDRAVEIYKSMGYYLGYATAYYAEFYDINRLLLMGRVTSGEGGGIMVDCAARVLADEFQELSNKIKISLPDEKARRIGQSVAAASLPKINGV